MSNLDKFEAASNIVTIAAKDISKRVPFPGNGVEVWGFDTKSPRVLSRYQGGNIVDNAGDFERVLRKLEEEVSWNLARTDNSAIVFVVNTDSMSVEHANRLTKCMSAVEGTRIFFVIVD